MLRKRVTVYSQSGPNVAAAVDSFADKMKTMEHCITTKMSDVESNLGQKVNLEVKEICATLQSTSDVRDCIDGAIKAQLEEDKYEEQEIEQRKTNIIIHGIAEPKADTSDERIEADLLQVAAMFEELKVTDVQVEKVIRLGKRLPDGKNEDDTPAKPRPMKVIMDLSLIHISEPTRPY